MTVLALFERPQGTTGGSGNRAVYDLDRNEARFGDTGVDGAALVWELRDDAPEDAAFTAQVELDRGVEWLLRCDRVDFPPGGVAYRHTHPGPGIRRLLFGSIGIETNGATHEYGPGDAWFERGPDPVLATASATEPTAFVRVMLLPREWQGKRTIHYVDPADEEKPKLQRPTVFFDQPIDL